jgi:type I restriction enzyme, S subunit
MKDAWQTQTLGEVCSFENGDRGTNYPSRSAQTSHGVPFINAGHLTDDGIDIKSLNFIPRKRFDLLSNGKIRSGDILFCLRGSLGKFASVGNVKEGAIASSLVIVRPGKSVLTRYIEAYFQSNLCADMIGQFRNGAAQPNLSGRSLSKFLIPVPPLPEQQRIVDLLDEAFEGIAVAKANTEKNAQNARALFQVYLRGVFSRLWKTNNLVTLADLATEITDGDHAPPPKAPIGVPFITIGNIIKDANTIDFTDTFMVPRKYFDGLRPNKKPRKGDVLYTVTGSYGIPVLVAETQDFCFQRHIGLIRPKPDVSSEWLFYLLMSPQIVEQANDGATGTAQRTVSLRVLRGFSVPHVPLAAQQTIAVELEAARKEARRLESIYLSKLTALQELERSLLQQAFSGELTKRSQQAVVVPFPTKVAGITTTDLHAGVLATAYDLHEENNRGKHFGHVKAEKIAHMVEAFAGIDLGRTPTKDAAGPNDYPHLLKVEHRARKAGYFNFKRSTTGGYLVKKLGQFDRLLARTCEGLGERKRAVDQLLELMLPMTTQQAELCATAYAAWNNLLLDGKSPTDEEIVYEARENWHSAKLNIPRERFFAAIKWLREKGVVPSGKGKKVAAKLRK